jgi:Bacterial Ig domain
MKRLWTFDRTRNWNYCIPLLRNSRHNRLLTVEKLEHRNLLAVAGFDQDLNASGGSPWIDVASHEQARIVIDRIDSPSSPITPQHDNHTGDDGTLRFDRFGLAYHHDAVGDINLGQPELLPKDPPPAGPKDPQGVLPFNSSVPHYHSNPSYSKKIYLDFDGQLVSGTTWNEQNYTGLYDTGTTIHAPAFSTDADVANFSASELAAIQEIWARVAEDFAPFQVDVTTENPGEAAFLAGGTAIRALISTNIDATTGQQWYPNAGGVAYRNCWYWTNGTPVWVFANRLGGSTKNIAEAASHEVGHAFDLTHDGRTSPQEAYYTGHGSGQTGWAPIMGTGYTKELVQWSRGEYANANNTEDDTAKINAALTYAVDDHGNTSVAATQLLVSANGTFAHSGLIATRTDVDAFKFATQAGNISLNVDPFDFASGKANLDVEMRLLNSQGNVVATVNNANAINVALSTTLPKGIYTVVLDGIGKPAVAGDEGYSDYASLGKYAIGGIAVPNRIPVAAADSAITGVGNSILIDVLLNDSDADQDVMSLWSVGPSSAGITSIEAGKIRFTPPVAFVGRATFQYTIVDELGASANGTVTVDLIPNVPPTLTAAQSDVSGNEGSLLLNTGTWADSDLPANTVTLVASVGSIVKNSNGTWSWQIDAPDQIASTNVVITANDGLGGLASVSFTYSAVNLPPVLTRNTAVVNGLVLSPLTNDGNFSDVAADVVSLAASIGTVTKFANGTWAWSYVSPLAIANQTVTITATDEDGGLTTTTFIINAIAGVSNGQFFYNKSSFLSVGGVDAALDSARSPLRSSASSQTTSSLNVINYSLGINGFVLDIPGLVNSRRVRARESKRLANSDCSSIHSRHSWHDNHGGTPPTGMG